MTSVFLGDSPPAELLAPFWHQAAAFDVVDRLNWTQKHAIRIVKGLFKWAKDETIIEKNPLARLVD